MRDRSMPPLSGTPAPPGLTRKRKKRSSRTAPVTRAISSTHKTLFEAVYPWAGEDRLTNAPGIGVSKGSVLFARPDHIRRAIDYALEKGQDKAFMLAKPGEIMGHLAYGHPFLDGNGRACLEIVIASAAKQSMSQQAVKWIASLRSQ